MAWEAVAAAGGSLLSSIIAARSVQEENAANKTINRETRDWQSKENQLQRDYQTAQWEREMAYNTPAAQMQRYKDAGLNPYISDSALGSGDTNAPSAPPSVSAPTPLAAHAYTPPDFGLAMADIFRANAEASNQSAQSLETAAQAAKAILDITGDKELAAQALSPYLKASQGINFDSGTFIKRISSESDEAAAKASLAQTNAELEREFGKAKYERVISKYDYEYQESVARVGLWSNLTKLNDSIVNLNQSELRVKNAQIRELLARAYMEYADGLHSKELATTESQSRKWFVAKLRANAGAENLDLLDIYADWLERGDLRDYKATDEAQEEMLDNYQMDNSPNWRATDKLLNTGQRAVGIAEPFVTRKSSVRSTRQGYYRKSREGRTPQGYKSYEEYSVPYGK